MNFQYRKNVYVCEADTSHHTVTIDRDVGVTPFLIQCETCGGGVKQQSSMYRVDQNHKATHEWYKPDAKETALLNPWSKEHVSKGGLMLRKIEE